MTCVILSTPSWSTKELNVYFSLSFVVTGVAVVTNMMMVVGICRTNKHLTIIDRICVWFGFCNTAFIMTFVLMCLISVLRLELQPRICLILYRCVFYVFSTLIFMLQLLFLLLTFLKYLGITKPLHSKEIISWYSGTLTKQLLWFLGSSCLSCLLASPYYLISYEISMLVTMQAMLFFLCLLCLTSNLYLVYYLKTYPSYNQQALKRNKKAVKRLLAIMTTSIVVWLPSCIMASCIFYIRETGDVHLVQTLLPVLLTANLCNVLLGFVAAGFYPWFYIARSRKIRLFYKRCFNCTV